MLSEPIRIQIRFESGATEDWGAQAYKTYVEASQAEGQQSYTELI